MPRETYLHLGVVGCHAKAHQAEGHELLLVDVHVGPGVVLGERAAGSGLREGLGPTCPPLPGQSRRAQLRGLRTLGGLDPLQGGRDPLTPRVPREPDQRKGAAKVDLMECQPIEKSANRKRASEGFFISLGQPCHTALP